MKLLKILAIVMAICLLGTAFIACDKGGATEETTPAETTAAQKTTVTVTLTIKDGSTTKYEGTTTCNGTLGDAIEMFCFNEFEEEIECFNSVGILKNIGELSADSGKSWTAYFAEEGKNKAFKSIKDQPVSEGDEIIIVLG